ncbi:hypothetical protein [Enterococcus faecalis]|uniref:Uncharacterized protein n=1 Tax=Enterococcus faecalis ATCC 6055 TaxID=1169311 RepID=R3KAE1_ENTFL|nr:hypothetical protein [Enterococcus faecalis]EOK10665.1 hypothetical protein WOU_02465 [Enterococcus faecalis ATCC 6055]
MSKGIITTIEVIERELIKKGRKAMSKLSERKQALHNFLIEEGKGYCSGKKKGDLIRTHQELWAELSWLERFERKVCRLSLVQNEQIFYEWKQKKTTNLHTKILDKLKVMKE